MHECRPADGDILAFSGILDAFDEGLLIITPDNRVACVNRYLRHLLGIDRDAPCGTSADTFVRRVLAPRICEESGRAEILASLSAPSPAADILCTIHLPGGGKERVRCSCRAVQEGPFRGSRLTRLSPEPSALPGGSASGATPEQGVEEILPEREGWHRLLVENLNEGIWMIDARGVTVFVNRKMADILGYPAADMIGRPFVTFFAEEDVGPAREHLRRWREGTHEVFEFAVLRGDGARIHTLMATTPITGAGGTCRGFLVGVQDITPLKRMKMQFRESEQKYRSLVELSAEATLIHRDGEIVYLNPACARLLGASCPEEIVGKDIRDFVHPESRGTIEHLVAHDLRGEGTPLTEVRAVRLDGTTIPIEGRGTRVFFGGRPAVQAVIRDITHRKLVEDQLQARNRHLLLLNRIIAASASIRLPGDQLEMLLNQTLDLLDYDSGAIYRFDAGEGEATLQCRRNIPDAFLERARSIQGAPFADTFATGLPRYLEQDRGTDTSGSSLLRELGLAALACIPLAVESDVVGALLIGSRDRGSFSRDERALLEAVGREIGAGILRGMLYRKLEVANREANLYLDILTHDIKNADNVTNIYADLLIDELEGEPARHARKLKDGIRKSIEITANVATIRKIHESRAGLVPLDLHDVIREEIAHFPDLSLQYSGMPVEVLADDLLPEIFTNLIGNAAKHGGQGVEVTVAVEDRDERTVIVTVADTGPGVQDDAKGTIFFRFEREGGRRGSQGLGLSICRMLAARYGGKIWVEDRVAGHPEEGAAFLFTLRKAGRGRNR